MKVQTEINPDNGKTVYAWSVDKVEEYWPLAEVTQFLYNKLTAQPPL